MSAEWIKVSLNEFVSAKRVQISLDESMISKCVKAAALDKFVSTQWVESSFNKLIISQWIKWSFLKRLNKKKDTLIKKYLPKINSNIYYIGERNWNDGRKKKCEW